MKGALVIGTVGLVGLGAVAATTVATGTVEIAPSPELQANIDAALGGLPPGTSADFQNWLNALPVGWAAMLLLLIVYRGPIGHIIITTTNLWAAYIARKADIDQYVYGTGVPMDSEIFRQKGPPPLPQDRSLVVQDDDIQPWTPRLRP